MFQNTEIAFKIKTDKELKNAYWLFYLVGNKSLVKLGRTLLNFALAIRFPIKWIVKPTIFKHFCGGETLSECTFAVKNLEKHNVKAILDYSVEGKESPQDFQNAIEETLKSIHFAANNQNIPFAVFKPSAFTYSNILEQIGKIKGNILETEQLAEELDLFYQKEANLFFERINILCKSAWENNVPILIDAEDFAYQNAIDKIAEIMMLKYNKSSAIVYNTLQMYRWDRLDYLKQLYQKSIEKKIFVGVKFVRGAYMEKERKKAINENYPSPIQPNKTNTDNDFNKALEFTIEHLDKFSLFCGTHNEESTILLTQLMNQQNIVKNDKRIYFAQLYGMSDHISFNLAKAGYNVAKYVPYGEVKQVMPYLVRRAEENTSVAGQTGRELKLIIEELKRRKSIK